VGVCSASGGQPFVEALRPLGALRQVGERTEGSQLRLFETALAMLTDRAAAAPVLVVLKDLHWADTSTLDLGDAALAALRRAVEVVPAQPPSPERAQALAALANGLIRPAKTGLEHKLVMR
jgi:hypothetical protein